MIERSGTAERRSKRRFFRRERDGIRGAARVDLRTKDLLLRLRPGDIAIIAHEDLDQVAAEGLVERGAAAVINAHRSITGRYPNAGPLVLARARIPLIDAAGDQLLEQVRDGEELLVKGAGVWSGDRHIAQGILLDGEQLDRVMEEASDAIGVELERFVRNTMEYLTAERDLVLHGGRMPVLRTRITGRHAVVVIRGAQYREDLRTLRGYINDIDPVLIAVDGAADALLEEGYKPAIVIGDMDSISNDALTCGAEVVVHAYPDGHAPGLDRTEALGLDAHVFPSAGTSEDIALLLAYGSGADLIVAVGAHDNLVEFLDKGRSGMASTFVVRLKVGAKLVDAKGVNRLYTSRVRTSDMVILVAAAAAAMMAVVFASPALRLFVRLTADWFRSLF
ncbi:MAG TPA: putative cytokinetic ring protein SteA [Actinomycetota bacterium]